MSIFRISRTSAPIKTQSPYTDTRFWYLLTMSILRISRTDADQGADVDSIDDAAKIIESGEPGRYHVDEISADPLPSGHTSRRWGVGIKRADGSVTAEPDPWDL